MKKTLSFLRLLACLAASVLIIHNARAGNDIWSGASGANLFWSTPGNWTGGLPGTNDDALFFDGGATNNNVSIDDIVTVNTTVHALRFGQTNGIHNMFINSGVTLTVAGTNDNGYGPLGSNPALTAPTNGLSTMFAGCWPGTAPTSTTFSSNTISGPGTLVLDNTNNELNVRQCHFTSSTTHTAVLDMSGLNTFTAILGRIRVGDGEAGSSTTTPTLVRAQGQLLLAKTNTITLSGTNSADNDQLVVGNNDVNNNGNSSISTLDLGQANIIHLDKLLVGGQKQQGQILYNPAFATNSPSLVMRASDGVSRVSAIRIGDESDAGATGNATTGTFNVLPGTSDILADQIIVGRGQNGAGGTTAATGNLLVGSGTLNVNTLDIASQFNPAQGGTMTGTVTLTNTTTTVNSLLRFGHFTGGTGARNATLNINGGSFTVVSNITTEGTATIRVTNAVLALPSHPSVLASIMVLDGGTISNAATLKVTNSLTVLDNGQIVGGNPVFDMGNSGSATWDVTGATNGTLTVSNVFQGSGSFNGELIQAVGATINPGGSNAAGTLTINGNLVLNGGTLRFDLSNTGGSSSANDQINASAVTLNGTNNVVLTALSGGFDTNNPYVLITSGGLSGNQAFFQPAGGLGQSRFTFTFDTTSQPNNVLLNIGGVGPANLTWAGDGTANLWDLKTSLNWRNPGASQFFSLDNVTFDDTGSASPSISLVGTLNPGSITLNNSAKNYTFTGTGGLIGAPLTKSGTGALTFSNVGDNSFNGAVNISGGAVTFGNTGQDAFLNGLTLTGGSASFTGNSAASFAVNTSVNIGVGTSLTLANANPTIFNGVPVEVDGSLTFNQSVDSTADGVLAGAGAVTKNGTNTLTLAGANGSLGSVVQINAGTVKAGSTSALGSGGATITNSATLDLAGQNLTSLPVIVSGAGVGGNGAIVSSQGILITGTTGIGLNNVTLAGNTTIGGSGAFNSDPIKNVGCWGINAGTLSTGGSAFNLTKVGLNQISLNNSTLDPALANINVQQGLLDLDGGTSSLGNPAANITISAGAEVSFNATTTPWDKNFILFGDGVTPSLLNYNGANTVIGLVTLNGSCVIGGIDPARGAPVSITLSSPVGGTGALAKTGNDTLVLAATNTYSGATTIGSGVLLVTGVSGTNTVTATGGTLAGSGIVRGAVTISSGGTLSPGDTNTTPIGTLSVSNTLVLSGTCALDLDKTSGVLTSDLVTNITSLTIGGTLQLNITGDTALALGDTFKIFSFGMANGAFASINPPTPGDGLGWDTSTLKHDGILRVSVASAPQPVISSTVLTGSSLVLSITNGTPGGTNFVLTATNVTTPVTNWTVLATNLFDGNGNSSYTNTVNPSTPQRFFIIAVP